MVNFPIHHGDFPIKVLPVSSLRILDSKSRAPWAIDLLIEGSHPWRLRTKATRGRGFPIENHQLFIGKTW